MLPILGILDVGMKILDKFIPDPQAKADAQFKLMQMQQTGELAELAADTQLAQGQIDTNKVEAASTSLFVSGWRPFVGWVCASSLAFQFILFPFLMSFGLKIPALDLGELMTILLGLLGLGSMRSYEKIKGKA